MVPAACWESLVIAAPASFYRLAAVGLIVAGLALSGCGRKGPLDAPPGGLAANPDGALETESSTGGEVVRRGSARQLPIIKGPDRSIPLDILLN
jgi:predicted small lipoprotein YifL